MVILRKSIYYTRFLALYCYANFSIAIHTALSVTKYDCLHLEECSESSYPEYFNGIGPESINLFFACIKAVVNREIVSPFGTLQGIVRIPCDIIHIVNNRVSRTRKERRKIMENRVKRKIKNKIKTNKNPETITLMCENRVDVTDKILVKEKLDLRAKRAKLQKERAKEANICRRNKKIETLILPSAQITEKGDNKKLLKKFSLRAIVPVSTKKLNKRKFCIRFDIDCSYIFLNSHSNFRIFREHEIIQFCFEKIFIPFKRLLTNLFIDFQKKIVKISEMFMLHFTTCRFQLANYIFIS